MTRGLVKKTREVHLVNEITGEMILDIFQRASSPARLERLRARVQQHLAHELHEHYLEELARIERHFVAGADEAVLKLMLASLELKMDLADTDQYVKPVAVGQKFIQQQTREGKLGPIAKRIKKYIERHEQAKALEVWNALASKPGTNFTYCDNPQGRYIEDAKTGVTQMGWGRFGNLVAEHRPKKK